MELVWQTHAWEDYLYWQQTDKKVLQRINELIKDSLGNPFKGIGKPEPLKGKYAGFRSRRITDEHRLVYTVKEQRLHILQCRFHYENKN
jgi:toxin YoeB